MSSDPYKTHFLLKNNNDFYEIIFNNDFHENNNNYKELINIIESQEKNTLIKFLKFDTKNFDNDKYLIKYLNEYLNVFLSDKNYIKIYKNNNNVRYIIYKKNNENNEAISLLTINKINKDDKMYYIVEFDNNEDEDDINILDNLFKISYDKLEISDKDYLSIYKL